MNWNAVNGIVFRHLYNFKHSWDRLSDAFYWPAMDIFLWGFTSVYITKQSGSIPGIAVILLSGLILWQIVLGILKMFMSLSFAVVLAYVAYKANIFLLGFYLIPFMANLLITGWAVGLIVAGLIVLYGMRIQTLAWTGIFMLAPFSAVYYPVSTLPVWAQKIASFIPTSYIFEGMRDVIINGKTSPEMLSKSFLLNGIFLVLGFVLFNYMFTKSKTKGLARLE